MAIQNKTYLARGRQMFTQEWVQGFYYHPTDYVHFIVQYVDEYSPPNMIPVYGETVGLYLGTAKGQDLFEGDLVKCGEAGQATLMITPHGYFADTNDRWLDEWNWADDSHRFKLIGNIYDNPELKQ